MKESILDNIKKSEAMVAEYETLLSLFKDPMLFVQDFLIRNNASFKPNGLVDVILDNKPNTITFSEFKINLSLEHNKASNELRKLHKILGAKQLLPVFTKDTLLDAYTLCEMRSQAASKAEFVSSIQFKVGSDLSLLRKWVKAVTGAEKELDIAVMYQWMWGVKNKMHGVHPKFNMVPVLCSPKQQIGKTTAVEKLIEPFGHYKIDKPVNEIIDSRHYAVFKDFFICMLDELAGIQRAEAADLKTKITAKTLSGRPMGTNKQETFFVSCSFIGTSNRSIASVINDHTGNARFWQMDVPDYVNRDEINSIDYTALWQSIDHTVEAPILPYESQLRQKQEEHVVHSAVKLFLDSIEYNSDLPATKFVDSFALYRSYQQFCVDDGEKPTSKRYFGMQLVENGLQRKTINNVRGYLMNQEAFVGIKQPSVKGSKLEWAQ